MQQRRVIAAALASLCLAGCSKHSSTCDQSRQVVTYNPNAAGNEIYREPAPKAAPGCEPWP